jgi:hypothetical protein
LGASGLLPTSKKHLKLQNSNEPPQLILFDEQDAAILEHVLRKLKMEKRIEFSI